MFLDREQGARALADEFAGRALRDPLVLAIPRGGVVTGAILAETLNAELDVVLVRKLRAPLQPELAIGAIDEAGRIFLDGRTAMILGVDEAYLAAERTERLRELRERAARIRAVRPKARIRGRSVVVVDDGIATGATMRAALTSVRAEEPAELIAAAPVASPDRLEQVRGYCDDVVCAHAAADFYSIGQFYATFPQVDDDLVLAILGRFAPAPREPAG
jgi:putative phosphoribosyl transferase